MYLERRWLALDPDLVLIQFYLNDAYDDRALLNRGQELGIYDRPTGPGKHSYLADLVQHRVYVYRSRRAIERYYRRHFFADAPRFLAQPGDMDIDWTVARQALVRAVELARQHKVPIALVIFPEFYQLDGNYPFEAIHRVVRETCQAVPMPVLDLLDVYRGKHPQDLWVHPTDHHPNEKAHKMAAEAIEAFLSKGILR